MSKIAIISQPDKGVLIDLGGCSSLPEAAHHLTSTLQISSDFWNGVSIDLNLGQLALTPEEVAQIISIAAEVGVKPAQVFADNSLTQASLEINGINIGQGAPMRLPETAAEEAQGQAEDQILLDTPAQTPVESPAAGEPPLAPSTEATEAAPAAPTAETTPAPTATAEPEHATADGETRPATPAPPPQPVILYLRQTLRSGQAVSHKGHLVIIGDVNPGAEVMAEGDITVWGALRGIAHAGIGGNTRAEIRALKLQPVQLRIAHAIARSPDRPRKGLSSSSGPETARVVNGTIRISATNPD